MQPSFVTVFLRSLSGLRVYGELVSWPVKRGVAYFLSVGAVFSFLALWIHLPVLILSVTDLADWAVRKLPVIRIEEGSLQLSQKGPSLHELNLGSELPYFGKNFVFVIDPEDVRKIETYKSGFFLKKDRMIYRDTLQTHTIAYPKRLSVTVTSYTLIRWRDLMLWILPVYIGLRTYFYLVVLKGIEVAAFAALCFMGLRVMKINIPLGTCFVIASAAMTPALLFAFITGVLAPQIPLLGLGYYALYLAVMMGALKSCVRIQLGSGQNLSGS